jgi:hypothetical protein
MDLDAYLASLDLLDTGELAQVLSRLNISEKARVTAEELYLSEKLPFAFNYVDGDYDVTHDRDGQGEHGSHVAGIAAANRFIPTENGYADAVEAVYAAIISTPARQVLERGGIAVRFGCEVSAIKDRTGTDFCPMESAVWDIDEPLAALSAVEDTLAKL